MTVSSTELSRTSCTTQQSQTGEGEGVRCDCRCRWRHYFMPYYQETRARPRSKYGNRRFDHLQDQVLGCGQEEAAPLWCGSNVCKITADNMLRALYLLFSPRPNSPPSVIVQLMPHILTSSLVTSPSCDEAILKGGIERTTPPFTNHTPFCQSPCHFVRHG